MTEGQTYTLAWLGKLTQLLRISPDLVIQPVSHDPNTPALDFGPDVPTPHEIRLPIASDDQESWRRALADLLTHKTWQTCLINLLSIPIHSIETTRDGLRWQDGLAFLAEALCTSTPGHLLVVLSPLGLLLTNQHTSQRAWLASHHRLEWLVYLGSTAANLLGVHRSFPTAVLVIRAGSMPGVEPHLLRLVDLTNLEYSEWKKVLVHTTKRGGGEVGPSIVLRNPELDDRPWIYQRFSKQFHETREDARQLGSLKPLEEWVESIRVGLKRTIGAVELSETTAIPADTTPCFGGRSIQRGGQLGDPVCAVKRAGISKEMMLRPGDVLVRAIVGLSPHHEPILAARVPEHATPATFDRTCIRLRWRPEVDDQVIDLLVGYLNSQHARQWLIAHGVQVTLNPSLLRRLEVPDPSPEVVQALRTLSQAEERYRQWADEVLAARQELFAASSYGQQVAALLERQRIETERIRAAEDSQSLAYQIRNYYPHPIALRREVIAQQAHGKARLDNVLECAEYVITLLAIMALIQVSEDHNIGLNIPSSQLRSFCREGSLHLDWGKCLAIVREGAAFTLKHTNQLLLPFPNLGALETLLADDSSDWTQAEHILHKHRNNQSHLQRLPEVEMRSISAQCTQFLDVLLSGVPFLGMIPLVHVVDYQLRPASGERVATFQLLQGTSPVFQQHVQQVTIELPRGVVGFLDHHGTFRSVFPWLIVDTCPVCQHAEIFVFNRIENALVTYVAMETGHPYHPVELANRVNAMVCEAAKGS
jgi:hypothetical protein